MTFYTLKNGIHVDVQAYREFHAESISRELFDNLEIEIIIQQRKSLLSPGLDEVYSVCCCYDDKVIGVCTGVRKRWYGERHRIEMVQVVVRGDFQGLGVARYMIMDIATHFKNRGVEILQISAEEKNQNAIRAYEKIGFRKFGVLERGFRNGDKYSNEVMLAMKVDDLIDGEKDTSTNSEVDV